MNINIRLANLRDITRLTDHIVKYFKDPRDFCRTRIAYSIRNNFIVLAEDLDNKEIAGKLIFQAKENPKLGVGEFEAVEVHPEEYQGIGIGSRIVQRSIEEARRYFDGYDTEMRWLYLFVRSDNEAAKNLYKKFGFKEGNLLGKMFVDKEPDEQYMYRSFVD